MERQDRSPAAEGGAPVAACGCVPANGETPGYVARILGLMAGASGVPPLEFRLAG